jgi:hypothetical protein
MQTLTVRDPFWEDDDLLTPADKGSSSSFGAPEEYYEWLNRGKALCQSHGDNQWNIGDWLVDGECAFDFKSIVGDIPRHLLIGREQIGTDGDAIHQTKKIPNFWKDAAAETNMVAGSLKSLARVARVYPKEQRFPQLSFTHHYNAASYGRRLEYLQACLDGLEPGQRPRSLAWLDAYIESKEGKDKEVKELATRLVSMALTDEMHRKLKQCARYYRVGIPELLQADFTKMLAELVPELGKNISLEKYGFWEEGKWPFYEPSELNKRLDAEAAKNKKPRARRSRRTNAKVDPAASERYRALSVSRWSKLGRTN